MIKKVLPIMVLGMAAQDYANKSGKKKSKEIVMDSESKKHEKKESKSHEKKENPLKEIAEDIEREKGILSEKEIAAAKLKISKSVAKKKQSKKEE